ncbi:adenosine receptor A3-like [Oculina patagonica]
MLIEIKSSIFKKVFKLFVIAKLLEDLAEVNKFCSKHSNFWLNYEYYREMATVNFTEGGKQKTFLQMMCSAGLNAGIHDQLTFFAVLNISLSITAFLGNALILVALRKKSSLHLPSKLLLRSLVTTDLCVGLILEPVYVIFLMSVVNQHWNICNYTFVAAFTIGNVLCGVSLLTVTAISVDRLLALLLGLRYRQVVTLKRTYVIVITFWAVCAAFATMHFWNFLITMCFGTIIISLCLVTSIFSFTKIFLKLRHLQSQVQGMQQPNQTYQLNIARYRKAVSSALWLQLTLVACYLPNGIAATLVAVDGLSSTLYLAWGFTVTLIFLNSSLNPILYCWKIDEVRQAVKDTMRQVLCCSSS